MAINIGIEHEAHIPTQQEKTANNMWFSQENEDQRRTQNSEQTASHRPQAAFRLTPHAYPKSARVLRRSHFLSLMKQGTRFMGAGMRIDYRRGSKTPSPKLGITVSRRYGKAHARNRFKRLVREAFRQLIPIMPPGLELHVSPKGADQPVSLHLFLSDFKQLLCETGILNTCANNPKST